MKTLNWVRRIIIFPLNLIGFMGLLVVGFICTDFSNYEDVAYFKKTLKRAFR